MTRTRSGLGVEHCACLSVHLCVSIRARGLPVRTAASSLGEEVCTCTSQKRRCHVLKQNKKAAVLHITILISTRPVPCLPVSLFLSSVTGSHRAARIDISPNSSDIYPLQSDMNPNMNLIQPSVPTTLLADDRRGTPPNPGARNSWRRDSPQHPDGDL